MVVIRLYRWPGLSSGGATSKLRLLKHVSPLVDGLETELCFNVEVSGELGELEMVKLRWILGSAFQPELLSQQTHFQNSHRRGLLVEIGPRLSFSTAFSSNAVSICKSVGLPQVTRLEVSTRYLIKWQQEGLVVSPVTEDRLVGLLHDRMTQCRYLRSLDSFQLGSEPQPWWEVDVLNEGKQALSKLNTQLGLAFDEWDIDYYTNLFRDKLGRNPTSVECFDLAQSNSEHSRHWFFKGKMVINGLEKTESLIDMIIQTQDTSNANNVIKFSDNSSSIEGYTIPFFRPSDPTQASPFHISDSPSHIIFTAETHNFPTGVAPFSGATTGTGGRIRDIQAVGRGGNYIAGTAGYCVGNLLMPGYVQAWEDSSSTYPPNLAPPLQILIEASNGASDYGNKFGEPLISGFVRSLGISEASGERREWVKPVMFSGGVGSMQAEWVNKYLPEKGMRVVKLGGPVYRIGVGGGSASSVEVQGDNASELDYGAVQRGDAEMEQKLNRVIRACVEMPNNPILSIHDQGAGGNGNVLKELVEPAGAVIFTQAFELGDPTISTLELWGAEYQESNAMLCRAEEVDLLQKIAAREQCPACVVGVVTGTGRVVLSEEKPDFARYGFLSEQKEEGKRHPVDLDLDLVLGKMPQKVYALDRKPVIVRSLSLPTSATVMTALERVLRLPAVASKRYLTNKVDRCVTGLIAQQQCVGPIHTPLADVAVTALSLFGLEGVATAIGEQPIKGLLDPAAGARMAVAEALTNLVFARISCLRDVKCSGNWMWPAKLPGEGAVLYEACTAMCDSMRQLGIAVDGGKDSLSMAARVGQDTVKAPGSIVISAYAPCPDIRQVVTPDLKGPSSGRDAVLLLVDLSNGKCRLGGSALGQCYRQLGDVPPDMDDPALLARAFNVTQGLIGSGHVLAGHDVSDGGLVVCLLEMAFAGITGLEVNIKHKKGSALELLFSEELGWVLEVSKEHSEHVIHMFTQQQVPCWPLGSSMGYGMSSAVHISIEGEEIIQSQMVSLFRCWEETSYQLELLQTNVECAKSEFNGLALRKAPQYRLTFDPEKVVQCSLPQLPRVAVIREEGTNGDREMAAALHRAGFQVWDVTMQDLITGQVTTDTFRGIVFPGGFSYADVLGSAKGWAASLTFHDKLREQFKHFVQREDTFSLGVCNGCQLMGLMGWVGVQSPGQSNALPDVVLDHNLSERFECRWSSVRIQKSPALMLKGMEGSVMGVWVAHGEGRFTFRDSTILATLETSDCCAIKYVDDDRKPTEQYPFNPNGSPGGLAGICSKDGRHLAMMPHPERCTLMWQWPWKPSDWRTRDQSPWQRIFHNAYVWCSEH